MADQFVQKNVIPAPTALGQTAVLFVYSYDTRYTVTRSQNHSTQVHGNGARAGGRFIRSYSDDYW